MLDFGCRLRSFFLEEALVIQVNGMRPIKLERKWSELGGWDLWDFHRAESDLAQHEWTPR